MQNILCEDIILQIEYKTISKNKHLLVIGETSKLPLPLLPVKVKDFKLDGNVYKSKKLESQRNKQESLLNEKTSVRKHFTKGFLLAVLDLSGTLWPLLIPEYSGIKRRGMPFLGLRNPGISHYSDKYSLPFYEP